MPIENGKLRFGVIGCGHMATHVHCPNMAAVDEAETIAYCDVEESNAKHLLETYGGEYATTDAYRVISDDSLHGVLIQTGPESHPEIVQAAAKAGKHVFVEKPIAVSLADALKTVKAVEDSGIKFVFGTCNRLAPMVKIAKRLCPDPVYSYCQCAGGITHQACHNIDLAVNLFHKSPLATVYAGGRRVWGSDPHLPADSFSAILTFANGSIHTYIQHGGSHNALLNKYHFQLFGKDRCVYLAKRFKECHLMKDPNKVEQSWIFDGSDTDRGPYGYMGHFDELKELVDCIRNGGNGTMTVRDAAYVLAVEKAILKSVETGQVINFPQFLTENSASFLRGGKEK